MNIGPGIVIAAATSLGCARGGASPSGKTGPSTATTSSPTGQVIVEVVGCHNDRGHLLAALYARAQGFPGDRAAAFAHAVVPVHAGRANLVFSRVPAGPFAVVIHHDEDADFKMATGMFGIPLEGYGFSRDARGAFGPPSFDDCRLTLGADERKNVVIHVSY